MQKDDRVRLIHMLESAREAVEFVNGKSRHDLDADRLLALALVKCIEIIGEAASKISIECRTSSPNIPWQDIIGMRNRLIHAYFNIDLDIVWQTIVVEIPSLITELENLFASKKIK